MVCSPKSQNWLRQKQRQEPIRLAAVIIGIEEEDMIQLLPADLIAVESNGRYYYALVLDRIRLFGGNWAFAFHRSSDTLLEQEAILSDRRGFNAFIDFIWAKRDNRITRIARGIDTAPFLGPGFLKNTHATKEKAKHWFIYDMEGKEIKRVNQLTPDEIKYPLYSRIDDAIMIKRISIAWTPEQDRRI